MGLPGANDTPMIPGGTPEQSAELLKTIIADQRQMIADVINPDPSKVPQLWCPYKEVLEYYDRLRLRVPELNADRRKELVKVANKYAENARVAVRHVRRDGLDIVKKLEKNNEISEDDQERLSNDVQKATDGTIHEIDALLAAKEKEILTV